MEQKGKQKTITIQEQEMVNHPSHYKDKFECIEVMKECFGESAVMEFCLCNAFKYLWRCKKKGKMLEDLKKASWYIDSLISTIEG